MSFKIFRVSIWNRFLILPSYQLYTTHRAVGLELAWGRWGLGIEVSLPATAPIAKNIVSIGRPLKRDRGKSRINLV